MNYRNIILVIVVILLLPQICIGRTSSHYYLINDPDLSTDNKIDKFKHFDYSVLISEKHSLFNLGYIGENYRRIRIKFISVIKNSLNQHIYYVYGKSNVSDNICEFLGTIDITEIRLYNPMHYGVDNEYKDKGIKLQGLIIANYALYENPNQKHSGFFRGKLYAGWYLNKENKIIYDDIQSYDDSWCNSQFVGEWKSYSTNQTKVCNWGHARIPQSGDLDKGIGEFYPNEKYWDEGWEVFYKAWWVHPPSDESKKARDAEKLEWWK